MATRFQRIAIEIKQTKSILSDFVKSRQKCIALSQQLNEQIPCPNWKQYEQLEREVELKVSVLDRAGLVQLKNRLTTALSELLDIEHEMNYQVERRKAKREHLQAIASQEDLDSELQHPTLRKGEERRGDKREDPSSLKSLDKKKPKGRRESQLPFYAIKNDTVENKLDSISKFVASLKKSMKAQSQSADHFKVKDFLMLEPEYLKVRRQLQIHKMRQEELSQNFEKRVQEQVQKYLDSCEVVEETKCYKVFKVSKQEKRSVPTEARSEAEGKKEGTSVQEENDKILGELGVSPKDCEEDKVDINEVRRRVEEDFEQIKLRLQQNGDNLEGIFEKINETVEDSEQKLRELRGKRKKIFDDDIWDEMEKM